MDAKADNLPDLRRPESLPPEIYIPLVDSLYRDPRSLFIGTFFVVGSMLISFWRTGEPFLLACAFSFLLVAGVRGWGLRAYARARESITNNNTARRWELRYVLGAAVSVGLLGIWCFVAFWKVSDPFTQLVSFSMTIAYIVGVFGRNFGSTQFVVVQILSASLPMIAALLLFGDVHHRLFAALLVPFFFAIKSIAERFRRILLDAITNARDMSMLATQFDTALNNMPQGLWMFDAGRRLVVSNKRSMEMLNLTAETANKMSVELLLDECARAGIVESSQLEELRVAFELAFSGSGQQLSVTTRPSRTLALTLEPMRNGGLIVLAEDVTERRNAEAKINLARYDHLTGLPNRMFFSEKVMVGAARLQPGEACALLFLDLDKFKQVNDTLGHARGDKLLCVVADRLRQVAGECDVAARLAGDEFVIFRSPIKDADEAAALAKLVIERLGKTCEIDGHQLTVGVSVGVAVETYDSANVDRLLENADMALYRAKAEGGSAWRFFEPEMNVRASARRHLESDLREALTNGDFELWYQPLIDVRSQKIVTCEALLRWPHRTRGMIPPLEFIPIADDMGLTLELGKWVLNRACSDCAGWPDDIRVAVNLSPAHFRHANVANDIRDALAGSRLASTRLEIEITESALLPDTRATRECLEAIGDLGARVSLDDFGSGYSSLSYLHRFPLHKIKIDRTFLQEIDGNTRSLTLLRGVARLSTELGMTVTVEGVETDAQLALIAAEPSIDEVQGFLFGPPMPNREICALLNASSRKADTAVDAYLTVATAG